MSVGLSAAAEIYITDEYAIELAGRVYSHLSAAQSRVYSGVKYQIPVFIDGRERPFNIYAVFTVHRRVGYRDVILFTDSGNENASNLYIRIILDAQDKATVCQCYVLATDEEEPSEVYAALVRG